MERMDRTLEGWRQTLEGMNETLEWMALTLGRWESRSEPLDSPMNCFESAMGR